MYPDHQQTTQSTSKDTKKAAKKLDQTASTKQQFLFHFFQVNEQFSLI
jgi:hypothetical protein